MTVNRGRLRPAAVLEYISCFLFSAPYSVSQLTVRVIHAWDSQGGGRLRCFDSKIRAYSHKILEMKGEKNIYISTRCKIARCWINVRSECVCFAPAACSYEPLTYNVQVKCWYCTCADVVADALHGDDRIRYPAALQVPHHASDPTMHLRIQKKKHDPCNHVWILSQIYPRQHPLYNSLLLLNARCDDAMYYLRASV